MESRWAHFDTAKKHASEPDLRPSEIEQRLQSASASQPRERNPNHESNHEAWRNAMSVNTIEKLFVEELKDLYSAETQITKALPKMLKAATSEDLQSAFQHHLKETEGQIHRLEQVFDKLGTSPKGKTCEGIKGVLEEGEEMLKETEKGPVRDIALISAAQRVEHYEMAAYGTVRNYAEHLERPQIVQALDATLTEEKAADKKLTEIAQKIHQQALRAA
jgi:ferritin-like metal-binding protein YciE